MVAALACPTPVRFRIVQHTRAPLIVTVALPRPCPASGAASALHSAFAVMRQGEAVAVRRSGGASDDGGYRRIVPTIVFHGDKDKTVHPRNGDQIIAQSTANMTVDLQTRVQHGRVPGGHAYSRTLHADASGRTVLEQWVIHGAGHGWSGGSPAGSYTDPRGPDATQEMLRFFLEHPHAACPKPREDSTA